MKSILSMVFLPLNNIEVLVMKENSFISLHYFFEVIEVAFNDWTDN